jgi:hypothetical protein
VRVAIALLLPAASKAAFNRKRACLKNRHMALLF